MKHNIAFYAVTDLRSLEAYLHAIGDPLEFVFPSRASNWKLFKKHPSYGDASDHFVGSIGYLVGKTFVIHDAWSEIHSPEKVRELRLEKLREKYGDVSR